MGLMGLMGCRAASSPQKNMLVHVKLRTDRSYVTRTAQMGTKLDQGDIDTGFTSPACLDRTHTSQRSSAHAIPVRVT